MWFKRFGRKFKLVLVLSLVFLLLLLLGVFHLFYVLIYALVKNVKVGYALSYHVYNINHNRILRYTAMVPVKIFYGATRCPIVRVKYAIIDLNVWPPKAMGDVKVKYTLRRYGLVSVPTFDILLNASFIRDVGSLGVVVYGVIGRVDLRYLKAEIYLEKPTTIYFVRDTIVLRQYLKTASLYDLRMFAGSIVMPKLIESGIIRDWRDLIALFDIHQAMIGYPEVRGYWHEIFAGKVRAYSVWLKYLDEVWKDYSTRILPKLKLNRTAWVKFEKSFGRKPPESFSEFIDFALYYTRHIVLRLNTTDFDAIAGRMLSMRTFLISLLNETLKFPVNENLGLGKYYMEMEQGVAAIYSVDRVRSISVSRIIVTYADSPIKGERVIVKEVGKGRYDVILYLDKPRRSRTVMAYLGVKYSNIRLEGEARVLRVVIECREARIIELFYG